MTFTKQHFIAIANIIRDSKVPDSQKQGLIDELCSLFKRDNYLFNENKFRKACTER